MTLAHVPHGPEASDEPSPDSGDLRVSQKTAFESGIPPARERLLRGAESEAALEQLELVLVESTRAEANLGLLMRGLKHLAAGAGAAQEANAVLMQELESLRTRMSKAYESETLLQQRVQTLENALDAAARERDSWLVQEDAFLAGLLDDHEQKIFDIERTHERRLGELDLTLDELRQQRDSARAEVLRLTYERDAAVALLNEPVASGDPAPSPPLPASSSTSGVVLGAVKLAKPALRSKPDASTRPLVGYSLSASEVAEERLESSPESAAPSSK
jgi:regulator of replication initiation timing